MDPDKYKVPNGALENAYSEVYDFYARNRASLVFPRIAILSAQPGAGKSSVFSLVEAAFDPTQQPVHVDIDEIRPFTGQMDAAFADDPFATAFYTNGDSWRLTKRLLDDSKSARNNVIYETTLRSVGDIEEIIKGFQSESYAVDLHALAVNSKTSILGIHQRFESQLALLKPARWTPIDFHDDAYVVFPKNVSHLERVAGLEIVSVYRRSGEILYRNKGGDAKPDAETVIEQERGRLWTPQEKDAHLGGWQRVATQVERRTTGITKPEWYAAGVRNFLKEAELFKAARTAIEGEAPSDGLFEAMTHHHVFTRSIQSQEIVCFEKPSPTLPPRPAPAGGKTRPQP